MKNIKILSLTLAFFSVSNFSAVAMKEEEFKEFKISGFTLKKDKTGPNSNFKTGRDHGKGPINYRLKKINCITYFKEI